MYSGGCLEVCFGFRFWFQKWTLIMSRRGVKNRSQTSTVSFKRSTSYATMYHQIDKGCTINLTWNSGFVLNFEVETTYGHVEPFKLFLFHFPG